MLTLESSRMLLDQILQVGSDDLFSVDASRRSIHRGFLTLYDWEEKIVIMPLEAMLKERKAQYARQIKKEFRSVIAHCLDNIVKRAYADRQHFRFTVTLSIGYEGYLVQLMDYGIGFDYRSVLIATLLGHRAYGEHYQTLGRGMQICHGAIYHKVGIESLPLGTIVSIQRIYGIAYNEIHDKRS